MNHLLIHFPVIGGSIRPMIGCVDFAFAALFLSLGLKFGLPAPKTHAALAGGFTAAVSLATLIRQGLPVLPFMGVLFISVHFKQIKLNTRKEKRETLSGLLMFAALLAVAGFIRN